MDYTRKLKTEVYCNDISELPDSMCFDGDALQNRLQGVNNRVSDVNHFRRSPADIKLLRRKSIKHLVDKHPNIDHMTYKELMNAILFGGNSEC